MIYAYWYCKKHGEDKEKLFANCDELRSQGFIGLLKSSFFALLTPVIVLGGIYGGVVTPTEAADISVIYALFVSMFVYRTFKLSDIPDALRETAKTAAPVMLVVATATVFGRVLTMMQTPQFVAELIVDNFSSKIVVLLIVNLFLLFVGMIMDTTPAILILTPSFPSDHVRTWCRSDSFRRHYGSKPCYRLCYTADWSQFVRSKLDDEDPHFAYCQARSAFHHRIPACFGIHHFYP